LRIEEGAVGVIAPSFYMGRDQETGIREEGMEQRGCPKSERAALHNLKEP